MSEEIKLFVGGKYPAWIVGLGHLSKFDDSSITIKWDEWPEPKQDRKGTVYIGKDRKITGWVFDDE